MYLRVLQEAFKGKYAEEEEADVLDLFGHLIGSIVTLFDTLSVCDLGTLYLRASRRSSACLDGSPESTSFDSGPSGKLLRGTSRSVETSALVPSFRDFLLDKDRCVYERFWVHDQAAHNQLAERCLVVMSEMLRKDILWTVVARSFGI